MLVTMLCMSNAHIFVSQSRVMLLEGLYAVYTAAVGGYIRFHRQSCKVTGNNTVTCSTEYRNDGKVVPKELGKCVSAVTVQQVASQRCGAHAATNMEIPW
jgi:hypothetical protein